MIKWLKSWIKPDILSVDIKQCPCCNLLIKDEMKRGAQRLCNVFISHHGRTTFYCGQCGSFAEYLQKPDSQKLIFLRVVKHTGNQSHADLVREVTDLQTRYNVTLAQKCITHRPPAVTDYSLHSWAQLHLAKARLKRNLKKL